MVSVNLLETFRELFHEGQGTREFLGSGRAKFRELWDVFFFLFGAMDPLLTNWGSYGSPGLGSYWGPF